MHTHTRAHKHTIYFLKRLLYGRQCRDFDRVSRRHHCGKPLLSALGARPGRSGFPVGRPAIPSVMTRRKGSLPCSLLERLVFQLYSRYGKSHRETIQFLRGMLDGFRNFHRGYTLTSRITELKWRPSVASKTPTTTVMRINHAVLIS